MHLLMAIVAMAKKQWTKNGYLSRNLYLETVVKVDTIE